jgi:glycosyltransferase involved in cell wall biosynthesis
MRILFANGSGYPAIGGVENSLRYMARELVEMGHSVKLFCFREDGEPDCIEHEGVEITGVRKPQTKIPHRRQTLVTAATSREILPLLKAFKPDQVWCRNTSVGLGIARCADRIPIYQIFCTTASMNTRGTYLNNPGMYVPKRLAFFLYMPVAHRIHLRAEREFLQKCHPIVFSRNMRQEIMRCHPKQNLEIAVIPPGVDNTFFSPERGKKQLGEIERQYGLSKKTPFVLYVGRLSRAKNIPLFFQSMTRLRKSISLILVGDGYDESWFRACAQKLGLSQRVYFVGRQEELLPGFYTLARVTALATTIESFGQVYLESMACGTPVVGFAGDGRRVLTATDEIIQDGKTGGVVREVSANALAEKINWILSLSQKDYAAMSRRAREDVGARFSWRRFVVDVLALSQQKNYSQM